jgi:hypothetical protein
VRKYTVTWKNYNGTTLEVDVLVPYGTVPTYNSAEPVYSGEEADDYVFNGWTPTVVAITGDTTYIAKFKYTGNQYVKIIEKTISGAYENAEVTMVGDYTFYYCDEGLSSVSFPAVTTIGENAFARCDDLVAANIPNVTNIPYNAFSYCVKLVELDAPLATSVGSYALPGCAALERVNLPSVVTIDSYAFESCTKLSKVDLPVVTSIGKNAFKGCSSLDTLILRHTSVVTMGYANVLDNTPIENGTGYIYVPSALKDQYIADSMWSLYANQFRAIEDYPEVVK